MVYDKRDRLMMMQDGNLRAANKWMVILYDEVNRPVQTGLLLNTFNNNTFVQHLTAAKTSITYPFTPTTTPSVTYWEYLSKQGYDNYAAIPGASGLTSALDATYTTGTYMMTTYNASPEYAQQVTASADVKDAYLSRK